jgi:hypothetical protein
MNGFHTGTLRVYKIISDVTREFVWMMSGDQLPGWKSAAIEIDMTSVTEVTKSHTLMIPLQMNPSRRCYFYCILSTINNITSLLSNMIFIHVVRP